MNDLFRKSALPVMLLASTVLFSGCATQGKPPPSISLDEPVQAQPLPEPPAPVEVVAVNQCSGNSRGYSSPRVFGAQLANGAMGNARWVGVPLRKVLEKAGVAAKNTAATNIVTEMLKTESEEPKPEAEA